MALAAAPVPFSPRTRTARRLLMGVIGRTARAYRVGPDHAWQDRCFDQVWAEHGRHIGDTPASVLAVLFDRAVAEWFGRQARTTARRHLQRRGLPAHRDEDAVAAALARGGGDLFRSVNAFARREAHRRLAGWRPAVPAEFDPAATAVAADTLAEIATAVTRLRPVDQAVLLLAASGTPVACRAVVLGVSFDDQRQKLSRARKRLQQLVRCPADPWDILDRLYPAHGRRVGEPITDPAVVGHLLACSQCVPGWAASRGRETGRESWSKTGRKKVSRPAQFASVTGAGLALPAPSTGGPSS